MNLRGGMLVRLSLLADSALLPSLGVDGLDTGDFDSGQILSSSFFNGSLSEGRLLTISDSGCESLSGDPGGVNPSLLFFC